MAQTTPWEPFAAIRRTRKVVRWDDPGDRHLHVLFLVFAGDRSLYNKSLLPRISETGTSSAERLRSCSIALAIIFGDRSPDMEWGSAVAVGVCPKPFRHLGATFGHSLKFQSLPRSSSRYPQANDNETSRAQPQPAMAHPLPLVSEHGQNGFAATAS